MWCRCRGGEERRGVLAGSGRVGIRSGGQETAEFWLSVKPLFNGQVSDFPVCASKTGIQPLPSGISLSWDLRLG